MRDTQTAVERCATCGAELNGAAMECPSCAAVEPADDTAITEVRVVGEVLDREACAVSDPECAKGALWMRLGAAAIYAAVAAGCAYGAVTFLRRDITSSSDWIFGAMAIGLTLIALLGIKESFFPSDWKPE
jgi:hypothetical protein